MSGKRESLMLHRSLDMLFEPVCILDKSLKLNFKNTAWLQLVSKNTDNLSNEFADQDLETVKENLHVLEQKIRPFVEDEAELLSMKERVCYRICNYPEGFLLALNLSASEASDVLYDSLTDLPTRALLQDRIVQAITECKRKELKLGILFIDLDDFKPVNDNYGHDAGDHVLVQTVERIQKVVRQSDTLARYGGDEFVVVAPGLREGIHAALTAKRLLRVLTQKIFYKGHDLQIGASIGISIFPDHAQEPGELLKSADKAMYSAKKGGKNMYCFVSRS